MSNEKFEFRYVSPSIVRCESDEFAIEYVDSQGDMLFSGFEHGHRSGGLLYFPTAEEWDVAFPGRRGQREEILQRLIEYVTRVPLLKPIAASLRNPAIFDAWPKEHAYLGRRYAVRTRRSGPAVAKPFPRGLQFYAIVIVVALATAFPSMRRAWRAWHDSDPKLSVNTIYAFEGIAPSAREPVYTGLDKTRVAVEPDALANYSGLECEARNPNGKGATILLVNRPALEAISGSPPRQFPVNSVIFKVLDRPSPSKTRVVAMRKREPGYDPRHGDWAYLIGESYKPYESGRIDRCAECHAKAVGSDFVFNVVSKVE